jgi:hypothetical protein
MLASLLPWPLPFRPLLLVTVSVLTSGCTIGDCPPSSPEYFSVEPARFEELQARFGADGVPTEVCRELCRLDDDESAEDDEVTDCTLADGAVRCITPNCAVNP